MNPPAESTIDALNTATPNLADKPALADEPPKCSMGYILWDVFGSHVGFFKKRWEFPFISE